MLAPALIALIVTQPPSLSQCRKLSHELTAGDARSVYRASAPSLWRQFRSEARFLAFAARLRTMGEELRIIAESMGPSGAGTVCRRSVAVANWARGYDVVLTFDARAKLAAVTATPSAKEAPTIYGRYRAKTKLQLPITGTWQVLWGGRTWDENRHTSVPDERYALDLWVTQGGSSHDGDGARNEQYYAWGRAVLAPGDGEVVVAVDGVADNEPNRAAGGNLYGNFVVVDHGNGEHSLLAHLQKGSLKVRPGEKVRAGDELGKAGSSGMSTEPHLHYQLMDQPDWMLANGLPAQFRDYLVDTQAISRGEPHRGDTVRPLEDLASN